MHYWTYQVPIGPEPRYITNLTNYYDWKITSSRSSWDIVNETRDQEEGDLDKKTIGFYN